MSAEMENVQAVSDAYVDPPKFKYREMVRAFLTAVREYKKPTFIAIIFIALETLLECMIPFVMALLIDLLGEYQTGVSSSSEILNTVLIFAAILVALATCSLICGITSGRFAARASIGFSTNIRRDLFKKTTEFSFNNIDKFSVSSLVTRQTTDVFYIQMAYMMCIRIALRAPLMLIFSIVMAVVQSPQISWVYAITIPFLLAGLIAIIWVVMPIFIKVFKKYDALNESIEENVRGIRVVKTYARENYEKKKFKARSAEIKQGFTKAERIMALSNPIMMFSMYLSMALLIFIGSYMILDGIDFTIDSSGKEVLDFAGLTIGQLSSLITYGAQILSSLMMISMVFVMISMSTASMRRVYEVMIEEPTIKNCENPLYEIADGSIEFNDVNFKYKANAQKFALSNINLKIKSGEMVGIVGGTGSSKSTLVNLISRFYDTTTGEVLVGGKNVKEYDLETLRNGVSMVLQKNVLFSGTINENLRWGNKNATDDEIKEACKIAQADSFVESFPDKYETYIQQGGTNVSGGQKQRLCIARAILKKPKILILDDSTSAVDTKTDAYIRKGLRETLPDVTKIIIAQRVSSVQDADLIIVMDNGTINGMGTHDELLKTNKIYREIYDMQNRIGGGQNDQK